VQQNLKKSNPQNRNLQKTSPKNSTVIVAQSRTSNIKPLRFEKRCFMIENNGKKNFRKQSKTIKEGFSLP